jgi:hypothetical protein
MRHNGGLHAYRLPDHRAPMMKPRRVRHAPVVIHQRRLAFVEDVGEEIVMAAISVLQISALSLSLLLVRSTRMGPDFYIPDGGRNIPADSGAESLRLRQVLLRSRGGDGPDRCGPRDRRTTRDCAG